MRPTVVASGQAALAALQQAQNNGAPFALVLLDAMMPEMDGFTLAEQILQQPELAGATLMMLSSADRHRDAVRCRELGFAAYLTKPIKQSELQNTILTSLGAAPRETELASATRREMVTPSLRPLRILVVEDSLVNQTLAVRLLETRGHTVVVASTGIEALATIEQQPFDVVLMDVQMPEMDGFEATAAIRTQEQTTGTHLPIVAMTAHVMQGDRERCLEAGMDAYVAKPIQARALFEAIARLVSDVINPESEPLRDPPVTDLFDQATTLRRVDGDWELLQELVGLFGEECAQMMETMQDAIRQEDAVRIQQAAHTLKGEVSNFGARAAVEAALRLEMMGRHDELADAEVAYTALERALACLIPALMAFAAGDGSEERESS
jgi:CheY-like chemotaxis protein/HPt (histidine-containing phosphotransfer) domain-containing protein